MARSIVSATERGGAVRVRFGGGEERTADHLLLGTGYRVDIARYPFIAPSLLARVRRVNGYPVLGRGLSRPSLACTSSARRPHSASGRSCDSCPEGGTRAGRWPEP